MFEVRGGIVPYANVAQLFMRFRSFSGRLTRRYGSTTLWRPSIARTRIRRWADGRDGYRSGGHSFCPALERLVAWFCGFVALFFRVETPSVQFS